VIRTIIVDDEPLAREGIRMLLAAHGELAVVGEAGNGADALELAERLQPDLLFVDVQMPEMSGLELAARLPAERAPAVVFVTAYDEFAVRAFDVHALDYVLKPIDEARLAEAVRRARAHHQLADRLRGAMAAMQPPQQPPQPQLAERLAIRDGERVVFVHVDEIDWIEAADYYVEIHAGPHSYLHRETMQRLEALLDPARFVRIHRSRLVNRSRIRELRWEGRGEMVVVTTEGVPLKVSRSCRAKLQRMLQ
jgi:two-component system LytT family response regulator